jgi:hypothetical protein
MIQRIQTIYLLIASVITGLIFSMPIAEISANSQIYTFSYSGLSTGGKTVYGGTMVLVLLLLVLAAQLGSVFFYKKRKNQIKLIILAIVFAVLLLGSFYYNVYSRIENGVAAFKIAAAFPLISIILDFLAIRSIRKDEALVRSLDRIR